MSTNTDDRNEQPSVHMQQSAPYPASAPRGLRMHIGLFGRRNVGKSSLLNALTGQHTSIVNPQAGTTTDPVGKPMELLPLGPVQLIDTAGIDDEGDLGTLRVQATESALDSCDIALLVTEAGSWGPHEDELLARIEAVAIPCIIVLNKTDACTENPEASCESLPEKARSIPTVRTSAAHNEGIDELMAALIDAAPEEFVNDPAIIGDIVETGSTVVLVVPIDSQAPKGRLILPQVQVIRDLLDAGCCALTVRDTELPQALAGLSEPPALVITDSQVFGSVAAMVPEGVPLTGFSVAFARFKGDLPTQALGALTIERLTEESRVLIAESCTHHPIEEDVGTVKIPHLLRARVGAGLQIDHVRGTDFPDDLSTYDLVIHCGGCMFNRRAMLARIQACLAADVPVTNYGLVLAYCSGVFLRSIQAFPGIPELLEAHMCESDPKANA